MSQSSEIRFSIGLIAIEFTYGSRSLANSFGIYEPGANKQFRGQDVRDLIQKLDEDFYGPMPAAHLAHVKSILAEHEADFSEQERVDHSLAYNALQAIVKLYD